MKRKSCVIVAMILILLVFFSTISFSRDVSEIYSGTTTSEISGPVATILGIIQVIGFSCAIIMLAYIGIKFILATPDGKAELKKQMVPYIIGVILLFAGSGIAVLIGETAKQNIK